MNKKQVYNEVLRISKSIARSKKGALFIIAKKENFNNLYETLYPQIFKKNNLNVKGIDKVVEQLATLDGAVLISDRGMLIAFGAKLKKSTPVIGYGTKHAAASGTTRYIKDSTAILISEELNWIKIFQDGKIIMEMDPNTETPVPLADKIAAFLTNKDTALLTAAGVSTAILGLAPTVIVGGTYLTIKTAAGIIKKQFKFKEKEE
ncbi:DNA integrity scanning protein DisA nucleotide-binding domain protein [Candidatus Woesearchaeota archaeon]|nr:DNA integrity scanning protein DisA nucleotide-binding domain protein [Candidatus Woesearchaeota archaeon]